MHVSLPPRLTDSISRVLNRILAKRFIFSSFASTLVLGSLLVAVPAPAYASQTGCVAFVAADDGIFPVNLSNDPPVPATREFAEERTFPSQIVTTPDGNTVYSAYFNANQTLKNSIFVGNRKTGTTQIINLGSGIETRGLAINPAGTTIYVTLSSSVVVPIPIATNTPGTPLTLNIQPSVRGIAITPDGSTAVVGGWGGATIQTINLATGTVSSPVTAPGGFTLGGAIATTNTNAYLLTALFNSPSTLQYSVASFNLASLTAGTSIAIGPSPTGPLNAFDAIAAVGNVTYVVGYYSPRTSSSVDATGYLIPVDFASGTVKPFLSAGLNPFDVAVTSDGSTAYVVGNRSEPAIGSNPPSTITAVDLKAQKGGIDVNLGPGGQALEAAAIAITCGKAGVLPVVTSSVTSPATPAGVGQVQGANVPVPNTGVNTSLDFRILAAGTALLLLTLGLGLLPRRRQSS